MTKQPKPQSPIFSALKGLDETVYAMLGFDMKTRKQVEDSD